MLPERCFHDDGDAVRLRVDGAKEVGGPDLSQRPVREILVLSQLQGRVFEKGGLRNGFLHGRRSYPSAARP